MADKKILLDSNEAVEEVGILLGAASEDSFTGFLRRAEQIAKDVGIAEPIVVLWQQTPLANVLFPVKDIPLKIENADIFTALVEGTLANSEIFQSPRYRNLAISRVYLVDGSKYSVYTVP